MRTHNQKRPIDVWMDTLTKVMDLDMVGDKE
jgi:hypothetical protein